MIDICNLCWLFQIVSGKAVRESCKLLPLPQSYDSLLEDGAGRKSQPGRNLSSWITPPPGRSLRANRLPAKGRGPPLAGCRNGGWILKIWGQFLQPFGGNPLEGSWIQQAVLSLYLLNDLGDAEWLQPKMLGLWLLNKPVMWMPHLTTASLKDWDSSPNCGCKLKATYIGSPRIRQSAQTMLRILRFLAPTSWKHPD